VRAHDPFSRHGGGGGQNETAFIPTSALCPYKQWRSLVGAQTERRAVWAGDCPTLSHWDSPAAFVGPAFQPDVGLRSALEAIALLIEFVVTRGSIVLSDDLRSVEGERPPTL